LSGLQTCTNKKVPGGGTQKTERNCKTEALSKWVVEESMRLIDEIKQWDARALMTGERPVWWRRLLIRIFVGTKFPKKFVS